jgi:hypothetical protein
MVTKKLTQMPERLYKELEERIQQRYGDIMAKLPDIGLPNPGISTEATNDGFTADVRFYNDKGGYSSSLWEYINRDLHWHMYGDWKD